MTFSASFKHSNTSPRVSQCRPNRDFSEFHEKISKMYIIVRILSRIIQRDSRMHSQVKVYTFLLEPGSGKEKQKYRGVIASHSGDLSYQSLLSFDGSVSPSWMLIFPDRTGRHELIRHPLSFYRNAGNSKKIMFWEVFWTWQLTYFPVQARCAKGQNQAECYAGQ